MKCLQVEDITIPGINILVPFNSSLSPPPSRHVFQEERYGRPHCLTLNLDSSLQTAGSHSTDASTDASTSRSTPPLLNSLAIQTSSRTELEEWAGDADSRSLLRTSGNEAVTLTGTDLGPVTLTAAPTNAPSKMVILYRFVETVMMLK